MNMPFELGIDYGSRQHGSDFMKSKKCLILEKGSHDFKIALSDLSGVDIKSHGNEPDEVVRAVRDWFYETAGFRKAPYPTVIWFQFNDFTANLFEARLGKGISEGSVKEDIARMPISEYLNCVAEWVAKQEARSPSNP